MAHPWVSVLAVLVSVAIYGAGLLFVVLLPVGRPLRDPLALPFISLGWTLAVATVVVCLAEVLPHPGSGVLSSSDWFRGGWGTGLTLFGIGINSWWKYGLVAAYQTTRSILGSLLGNVFRPFLVVQVQGARGGSEHASRRMRVMLAQAACTIFSFFAGVMDMFLYLSQVDLSLVALVSTLAADSVCTSAALSGIVGTGGKGDAGLDTSSFKVAVVPGPGAVRPTSGGDALLRRSRVGDKHAELTL